jgi:hypothetical protein
MKNARPPEGKPSAPDKRNSNPTAALFPELEPAAVPARLPDPNSRAGEALQELLTGRPLTQADYLKTWRLAACIKSLKYDGWGISSELVEHPGCRRPIAQYRLDMQDPGTRAALAARGKA